MPIKHILIDLDDTLFDFKRAEREAISKTLVNFGVEPKPEYAKRYSEINDECWKALEKKLMTRDEVLVTRFERLFSELGVAVNSLEVKKFYEVALSGYHFLRYGAKKLVAELKSMEKYTLSIASNGTATVQDKRIGKSSIKRYFDNFFISQRLGADKPSSVFFEGCAKALGNPDKSEIIIVGDSLTSDIAGGIGFGIHTCYYNPKGLQNATDIKPEFEARRLCEIPEIINSIT